MTAPMNLQLQKPAFYDDEMWDINLPIPNNKLASISAIRLNVQESVCYTSGGIDNPISKHEFQYLHRTAPGVRETSTEHVVQNNPTVRYVKTAYRTATGGLFTKYEFHQDVILM